MAGKTYDMKQAFTLVLAVLQYGYWYYCSNWPPLGSTARSATAFSVPVQKGSGIMGFFARAGKYLDAIGVHVHHV